MRQRWVQFGLAILLLIAGARSAYSQSDNQQSFVVTQFGLDEGLPQNSVNHIIQTQDGYVWMATYGGLVRFDGNSFTVFNKSNVKGLATERILELYEDRQGGIWLFVEGDKSYIQRFKNGEIEAYSFGQKGETWVELNEDNRGILWASAYGNTYRFTGTEFIKKEILTDSGLAEKAKKDTTGVWFAYDYKIVKTLGDNVIQIEDYENEEKDTHLGYIEILEYPENSGQLFVGTIDNGIIIQSEDERQTFNKENGASSNNFVRFEKFDKQKLIVNFPGDIRVWEEEKFSQLAPIPEQWNVIYRSVLKDNEGNYWFGTDGDGLFKLRASPIQMIDTDQGLTNEKMLSITQLNDGKALFSSNCGGVFEWDGKAVNYSSLNKFHVEECNWSVFQDSKDRIWLGGNYLYVTNSLSSPVKSFRSEDGFNAESVYGIMEDSREQIWILSSSGLFVYDGNSFQKFTTNSGLYFNDVRSIMEDQQGEIWVGTRAGLNTIIDGNVEKVELLKALPENIQNNQPPVRAIYEDQDGYIWIGTYGNGLFRIDENKVVNITRQDGLFDDIISHIVEDEFGNFWMGSNRGLSMVSRKSLNAIIEGEIDQVQSFSFGNADGMNSAETNGGFQPNTFTDSLGRIYFPTVAGVAVVNPKLVEYNDVPPPVYIEGLRTDQGEMELSPTIELPYSTPFLEINYTAISFSAPKEVEFRYRMRGLDDSWIDVETNRSAIYSKIPPGTYNFQVIASNGDGVWNTEGASLDIDVIPPFWQTYWFYLLMGLSFAGFSGFIYYMRIRQLREESERHKRFTERLIESEEKERRRIAAELHDGLGQQILVIKNRAELAKNFIDDKEFIDEQLDEIMQSAVASITEARSMSYALRPVHLEKFGLTDAIRSLFSQVEETSLLEWKFYTDELDDKIPKEKEINLYRVIQEGMNNILKHSEADKASVIITNKGSELKLEIIDNGVGFDVNTKKEYGGMGLSGMYERVEILGGVIKIESVIDSGTTIEIIIPVKK